MSLFTYGSLMFPEVWARVTGITQTGLPAQLPGFSARRIRGQTYPALVASPGSLTQGVLYHETTSAALARLDEFEGSFYRRAVVPIITADSAVTFAWVYLASDPANPDILPEPWSAAEFAAMYLASFLQHDPGFSGHR